MKNFYKGIINSIDSITKLYNNVNKPIVKVVLKNLTDLIKDLESIEKVNEDFKLIENDFITLFNEYVEKFNGYKKIYKKMKKEIAKIQKKEKDDELYIKTLIAKNDINGVDELLDKNVKESDNDYDTFKKIGYLFKIPTNYSFYSFLKRNDLDVSTLNGNERCCTIDNYKNYLKIADLLSMSNKRSTIWFRNYLSTYIFKDKINKKDIKQKKLLPFYKT